MHRSIVGVVVLVSNSALAATSAPPPATERTMSTPADVRNTRRTVTPPPEEEGWTVIDLGNGYLRYRTDSDAEPDETEGTVSVMHSEAARAPGRTTAEPAVMTPPAESTPVEPSTPAPPDCTKPYELLAQRLLQLRGIDVDTVTAGLALPQSEIPFSPLLVRSMFGTEKPYVGGSFLISALSWDLDTRERAHDLAECLR